MASIRKYNALVSRKNNLSSTFNTNVKQWRKDSKFFENHQELTSSLSSFNDYSKYISNRNYNTALFLHLLMKIFVVLAPLIIISVILSKDGDFHFDFFQFVNRFASLQLNFSKPLLDFIKQTRSWQTEQLSFVVASGNPLEWLANIGKGIAAIGVCVVQFFTFLGLIVTFIIDFFANVFAFIGALGISL